MGAASQVSEILLAFKNGQISLWTMDYIVHGGQKIESPQNIHASKDMHSKMQGYSQSLVGVASPFLEILPNFSTSQK